MKKLAIAILALAWCGLAEADIWKWVDANGNVHFVDSDSPIFMWVDELGRVHYSDTPDHEGSVSVELVWVSNDESLDEFNEQEDESGDSGWAFPGETPAQRAEREAAEAYYCKRASEIYDSYVSAPRLYKTGDNGERIYLSDEEIEQTLAETRSKRDEMCQ